MSERQTCKGRHTHVQWIHERLHLDYHCLEAGHMRYAMVNTVCRYPNIAEARVTPLATSLTWTQQLHSCFHCTMRHFTTITQVHVLILSVCAVYNLLHVHPIRTTPYHPQTDGLVERFNKTLKSLLWKTASDSGKD